LRGAKRYGHVGDLQGDRLMLDDRPPQRAAPLRVGRCLAKGGMCHSDGLCSNAEPAGFEAGQGNL
jgi:hypothetical protein